MLRYYFDVTIYFEGESYDKTKAEEELGFKPTDVIPKNESKNPNAKNNIISLKTTERNNNDIMADFTEFMKGFEPLISKINSFKEKYNANIDFLLNILERDEIEQDYSVIGLEFEAMKILVELGASWNLAIAERLDD